mmetsp:Transcript_43018/g.73169  ORF Transcript_43018/g.73169 Transcript_43018/m.73169 type:complete len:171 (-) Transcript_43018:607-1119(-)
MPSKYVYPTFVESSICLWETGKQLTLTQFEDQMDKEQDVTWEKVPASTLMKNSIMPRTDAEREELQIEANLLAALKRKKTSRTGHLTPTKQVEPSFLMKQQIAHSRRVAIKRLAKSKRAFDEMQQNNTNPSKKMRTPSRTPPSRPPCPTSRLRFVCDGLDLLDDEPTCWG